MLAQRGSTVHAGNLADAIPCEGAGMDSQRLKPKTTVYRPIYLQDRVAVEYSTKNFQPKLS